LLFGQLLVLLEQRDLEQAVETTLLQTWYRPLDDNVDLFFLISGLHLEFAYNESLLLIEIIVFLSAFKNTLHAFQGIIIVNNY
jgi:hypothetical protein